MKRRVLPAEMRRERSWDARYIASLLVLPDATTHRRLVKRHEALIAASLPERGRDVRRWLAHPAGDLVPRRVGDDWEIEVEGPGRLDHE